MHSVFCTSTSTATEGSTRASSSTTRIDMKNVGAGAAVLLGDLDPHDPELEAGVDQLAGDLRLLVHLPDEGADLLLREVADDLPEGLLVLGEVGERQAAQCLGHGWAPQPSMLARSRRSRGMSRNLHACLCDRYPLGTHSIPDMSMPLRGQVTELLLAWGQGERERRRAPHPARLRRAARPRGGGADARAARPHPHADGPRQRGLPAAGGPAAAADSRAESTSTRWRPG